MFSAILKACFYKSWLYCLSFPSCFYLFNQLWEVSTEHLQLVGHANRGRLLLRHLILSHLGIVWVIMMRPISPELVIVPNFEFETSLGLLCLNALKCLPGATSGHLLWLRWLSTWRPDSHIWCDTGSDHLRLLVLWTLTGDDVVPGGKILRHLVTSCSSQMIKCAWNS